MNRPTCEACGFDSSHDSRLCPLCELLRRAQARLPIKPDDLQRGIESVEHRLVKIEQLIAICDRTIEHGGMTQ